MQRTILISVAMLSLAIVLHGYLEGHPAAPPSASSARETVTAPTEAFVREHILADLNSDRYYSNKAEAESLKWRIVSVLFSEDRREISLELEFTLYGKEFGRPVVLTRDQFGQYCGSTQITNDAIRLTVPPQNGKE